MRSEKQRLLTSTILPSLVSETVKANMKRNSEFLVRLQVHELFKKIRAASPVA